MNFIREITPKSVSLTAIT